MNETRAKDELIPTETNLGQGFRDAMSLVPAAVHVVTTGGASGRAGITATAIAPVSDAPPMLLVCINKESRLWPRVTEHGVFCVNLLGAHDQAIADAFARRTGLTGERRFTVGEWTVSKLGNPILKSGVAAFDCRLAGIKEIATHGIIFGEIVQLRSKPGPVLLHARRGYHTL